MFASDIVLKPRQRQLVSFFDEYKLKEKRKSLEKKPAELMASKTKLMKSSHGTKGDGPDHMEDLLTAPEQVHGIAEAIKEIAPGEDRVDKFILKRIICSEDGSDDSESEKSLSKSGRRNRMT